MVKNSDRTTPESNQLQQILDKMYQLGVEVVVMEVSSQSLKLDRVAGMEFYAGVFTNLSKDHISKTEHKDIEEYFNCKMKLFDMCKYVFINADNLYTIKVPGLIGDKCKVETYGIDNYCNFSAKDVTITNTYADFKAKIETRNERVKVSIPGRFSVYNALAAISVAKLFGVNSEIIKEALADIKVLGRSELVDNKLDLKIMIDYAHTPDSLENILKTAKQYTIGRVICVFGCGGDRDKAKRPLMGEISGRLADYTIITSDNPRTEIPEEIVKEIENGTKKTKGNYECIVDRREAIKKAISMGKNNDLIIIAGKGHEMYQEIQKEQIPFDERKIIEEIIEELQKQPKKKKK
jgi:UDP-N-acetylmuramoyl-L-alanyl-D-glutamate--2,6-diaminopimelate ligase